MIVKLKRKVRMIMQPVYLDANASEPVRPSVMAVMMEVLQHSGNPSSVHRLGRKLYHMVEDAREYLADCFGGSVQDCIFTSGGTEADVLAVYGQIEGNGKKRPLWVGATEHPAIMQIDLPKQILPVTRQGVIDLDFLEDHLKKSEIPPLVCLMLANNETGVIHPVREVADLCRAYGALLHVDAVQAAGRMSVNLMQLGANSLALSAHKMGGSKGTGLLLLASEGRNARKITPVFNGGGQEQGRRGGTLAVAGIVGMAAAAKEACHEVRSRIRVMRDHLEREMKNYGVTVCGGEVERLDNTSCLAVEGIAAQKQFMALDMAGFCVSTGSACSSGKLAQSPVLLAMGLESLAGCAIRVSLPWNVQQEEVDAFIQAYGHWLRKL